MFGQSTSENTASKPSTSRRLKEQKGNATTSKVTKVEQPQSSQPPPVEQTPVPEPPQRSVKPASQPNMDDIFWRFDFEGKQTATGEKKETFLIQIPYHFIDAGHWAITFAL